MSKAQRSEEIASTGMGLVNGIILHHYATSIPKAVALNYKEMQFAMDTGPRMNDSWEIMCSLVLDRIGLDIQDGNWELDKLVVGGKFRPLH
jgi:hypothetical protein